MKTQIELPNFVTLAAHLRGILHPFAFDFSDDDIRSNLYFNQIDRRTGWVQTWVVTIEGYGVIGFADGDIRA